MVIRVGKWTHCGCGRCRGCWRSWLVLATAPRVCALPGHHLAGLDPNPRAPRPNTSPLAGLRLPGARPFPDWERPFPDSAEWGNDHLSREMDALRLRALLRLLAILARARTGSTRLDPARASLGGPGSQSARSATRSTAPRDAQSAVGRPFRDSERPFRDSEASYLSRGMDI